MNYIFKLFTVPTIVCLTACSSSGSDGGGTVPSLTADVQGVWVSPCGTDADGDKTQIESRFNGSSFVLSDITYLDTNTCSGENYISSNVNGTFVVTGGVTELANGNAKHMDILFSNATLTAGSTTHAQLAEQGATLQDVATNQGIADINNIPTSPFGAGDTLYSIYRVQGNVLQTGESLGSKNGTTAELRFSILDNNDTYTRK